ncbi:MAG TPA: 2,3-bisphosphoglycerate-independent phosphoglycerate mutase, partial [Acidobacteriota bacterium]|nr:2,3-bisphosphoglycerate-independent phosphoglycerate mutase [Acidobacteriota bacterium]
MNDPLVLIVRDGWGIGNPADPGNAVAHARTPVMDRLLRHYPWTRLGTSGADVGLLPGAQGSSEVGHLNMGAGRIVDQEITRLNRMIGNGDFFRAPALTAAMS